MTSSNEIEHLRSLLKDFPADSQLTPEKAFEEIKLRSRIINELLFDQFLWAMEQNKDDLPSFFLKMTSNLHHLLFGGILSNAGNFRKESEPAGGRIIFGPISKKTGRIGEFAGSHCEKIESDLLRICKLLKLNAHDPVSNATIFYQQFVYIHPFYDGNGRIARWIVSLYLAYHECFFHWEKITQSRKMENLFISKLNKCHKKMKTPNYKYKIKDLVEFLSQFVEKFTKPVDPDF